MDGELIDRAVAVVEVKRKNSFSASR